MDKMSHTGHRPVAEKTSTGCCPRAARAALLKEFPFRQVGSRDGATPRIVKSVSTVSEITLDDMVRAGARTLDEALVQLPGLYLRDGADGVPRVDVRGLRTRNILLLVDGVPVNSTSTDRFEDDGDSSAGSHRLHARRQLGPVRAGRQRGRDQYHHPRCSGSASGTCWPRMTRSCRKARSLRPAVVRKSAVARSATRPRELSETSSDEPSRPASCIAATVRTRRTRACRRITPTRHAGVNAGKRGRTTANRRSRSNRTTPRVANRVRSEIAESTASRASWSPARLQR